MQLRLNKIF